MSDESAGSRRGAGIATGCGLMSFVAAGAAESDAAIIAYDFEASVETGPLAGSYTGSFSYDDDTPPHAADPPYEFVAVQQFEFEFAGQSLGLSDILTFNTPGVRFEEGVFAGLGGVDTGEGGRFFARQQNTQVSFEGEAFSAFVSTDFATGTVSYQLPEPTEGLLLSAAFLTLACKKGVGALWTRIKPRPTSGAGLRTPWRVPASPWRRAKRPRGSGAP